MPTSVRGDDVDCHTAVGNVPLDNVPGHVLLTEHRDVVVCGYESIQGVDAKPRICSGMCFAAVVFHLELLNGRCAHARGVRDDARVRYETDVDSMVRVCACFQETDLAAAAYMKYVRDVRHYSPRGLRTFFRWGSKEDNLAWYSLVLDDLRRCNCADDRRRGNQIVSARVPDSRQGV
ncbi:hypothetical protein J3459_022512 [Metarhizium acridum]|uniref:uncharacterized protein n=1 Tax=Metarhizium acridum TaxID=92637 RepID=UPI001C6AF512|nr:hypothetical protein J3458_022506 [Metarhizium acridum]KAG8414427.1 hypothetical protein J3459_022512 [Metarhizium acridum]